MEVEVRSEDMGPVAKDIVVLQETDLLKKKKRGEPHFLLPKTMKYRYVWKLMHDYCLIL